MAERPLQASLRWKTADRIGAVASFLCAIHCAALPFVLALLPTLGLGFLAGETFERYFVLFATSLALVTLVSGYRQHQRRLSLGLAVPGVALLLSGVALAGSTTLALHSTLVTCGGLLLAAAHFVNLRLHRAHGPSCAPMNRA